MTGLVFERERYTHEARAWLDRSGHYLENAPPGAFFAVGVFAGRPGLFGDLVAEGSRLGIVVVGRPNARLLPQGGEWGEITRLVLAPGLPHGTASALLRSAWDVARAKRGPRIVISYHDRTRHTGCVYRKAGMRKDGVANAKGTSSWGSREGRRSEAYEPTPKRRWRIDLW